MTAHSLARAEALVQLMAHLLPQDFGHGEPACGPEDAEVFWPEEDDPEHNVKIAQAKAICAECPIRASCLARALRTRARGVLGGTTDLERHRMLRSARRRAHRAANKSALVAKQAKEMPA